MNSIHVSKISNTLLYIDSEEDIALELNQHFTDYAEGWKFHPLVKQRRWDGRIRFFQLSKRTLPVGLLSDLLQFCADRGYTFSLEQDVKEAFLDSTFTKEQFATEIKSFPVSAYGEPIEWRDYQLLGIYDAIRSKRKLYSSNTSSGKSAIQYGIIRLVQERIPGKILLIVPGTALVEQMYSDFRDYSVNDEAWYVEDNCARLYAEYKYDNSKQILISTWQSLRTKDPEFFEQFSAVLCDEAHQAKAKEISTIMERCINAEYRLAFTGTVPKDRTNRMTIIGHFGPVKVLQTSKQAMDKGYVSKLEILGVVLNYDEATQKRFKKMKYQDEVSELCKLDVRNKYITDMAKGLKGNTLILTARVDSHGKVLHDMLMKNPGGKRIHYIFGEVDTEERERIRQMLEKETDIIVVANYQIVGTGWSVRNLHNVIFAFPSKSYTRVVQSVGRSLRKHESKDVAKLIDIGDNFGYSLSHFQERLNMYGEEQFEVKLIEVNLNESTNQNNVFEAD